jgi:1-deoxy-D-xylulose-5-phosphate reductoisomerase
VDVKHVAILGSTGSIGRSALAVIDAHPDRLKVVSLAAGDNAELLAEQVARYRPTIAAMATAQGVDRLRALCGGATPANVEAGTAGLVAVATHPAAHVVICASAGTAALDAVLAAIEAGKTIALANKEVLVMAGRLVMDAARCRGVEVLPIDSEHNALHQCLHGRSQTEIRRLILTASGGPFRDYPSATLEHVDPDAALRHPTWQMGRKITIDSATLMNKGLEVIEAHWLFRVSADQIDVVIHPQSIVHSMVELIDGSVIAHLGITDMRLPIQYACSYPERWDGQQLASLDLTRVGALEFLPPSLDRFPCLELAYRALRAQGTAPVVLNAANEVAVEAFLDRKLGFMGIPKVIDKALSAHHPENLSTLEVVRRADRWAREYARDAIRELSTFS